MFILKIAVALVLLVNFPHTSCSGILAPHPAVPVPVAAPLRYRLVAPQNIRPFAAQVSTFSRGLNIYAAPYAAGVLNAPAIVPRALAPGIPHVPGPIALPAAAPVAYPGVLPAPVAYPGVTAPVAYPGVAAPVAVGPAALPAAALPVPYPPAPFAPVSAAFPGDFLPNPFTRSVHAVAPAIAAAPALLG